MQGRGARGEGRGIARDPVTAHYLTDSPIDPGEWHRRAGDQRDGATVEFLCIVRGREDGRPIPWLDYEAYAPMAERVIEQAIAQATARWPLHQVQVRHRIGRVAVGDIALLIGVAAPHRAEAFEACQFLIDTIKRDAPIWKHGHAD